MYKQERHQRQLSPVRPVSQVRHVSPVRPSSQNRHKSQVRQVS